MEKDKKAELINALGTDAKRKLGHLVLLLSCFLAKYLPSDLLSVDPDEALDLSAVRPQIAHLQPDSGVKKSHPSNAELKAGVASLADFIKLKIRSLDLSYLVSQDWVIQQHGDYFMRLLRSSRTPRVYPWLNEPEAVQ